MKKVKAYDVPTRLFHWFFAALFVGAFFIAKQIDDESPVFVYHMMAGLTLGLIVLLRVIWGFVGTRYARFSSFPLHPAALIRYAKDLLTAKTPRTLGHNPASSWSGLIMMALALGMAITGILMTTGGDKVVLEDIHEIFANTFFIVVIGHVLGVAFHALRHRDGIALSMVHGRKYAVEGEPEISKTYPGVGLLFIAIVGVFAFNLVRNYNPANGQLNLFGVPLQLGETPEEPFPSQKSDH